MYLTIHGKYFKQMSTFNPKVNRVVHRLPVVVSVVSKKAP